MLVQVVRRCLTAVVMLVLISIIIFVVLRLLPGSPVIARLAGAKDISPAAIKQLETSMGLDRPLYSQYLSWIGGVLHGNFGDSYFSGYSVTELIAQRIGPTAELAVGAFIVAVVLCLVLSLAPMVRARKWLGGIVSGYTIFGMSTPSFVIGIGVLLLFGNALNWIPHETFVPLSVDPGRNLALLIAPAVTLGIAASAPLINYLRASLSDAEAAPYATTATGAGIGRRRVVLRHVTPNALLPALTALGVTVAGLLGGVVEVEYVFGWPGLGSEIVSAVSTRDYAVIQSIVLLAGVAYVVTSLVVDLLYLVLDPRLRVQPSEGEA
jgi:peptide/nickel transport system permease protein